MITSRKGWPEHLNLKVAFRIPWGLMVHYKCILIRHLIFFAFSYSRSFRYVIYRQEFHRDNVNTTSAMVSMTTFTCAMNGIFSSPSESEQSSYFREFLFHAWYRGILKSFKTWYSCTFPPLVKVPLRKKSYSLFPMQNGNLTCCLPNVPHWKFKPLLLLSGWWMRLIGNEFFPFPPSPSSPIIASFVYPTPC